LSHTRLEGSNAEGTSTELQPSVAVICGGVGAARLLRGAIAGWPRERLSAVVNVGDDTTFHGLRVCPDLDTILYTLSNSVNPETGWGLANETWRAVSRLREIAERNGRSDIGWFALGDLDIGTHLYRTSRLAQGASLTEVTTELVRSFDLQLPLLPVTDDPVATKVTTALGVMDFQDYFVRHHHDVEVSEVHFDGADTARITEATRRAFEADVLVIAPSNPLVSIGPMRAIPEVGQTLHRRREDTVAISPLVGGKALKGPADRMMAELGHRPDSLGVAALYKDIASTIVIDTADEALRGPIEALGMNCVVADTIMDSAERSQALFEIAVASADASDRGERRDRGDRGDRR
jgi:LPPG:FO 2-phospho-L-lactate transferase